MGAAGNMGRPPIKSGIDFLKRSVKISLDSAFDPVSVPDNIPAGQDFDSG